MRRRWAWSSMAVTGSDLVRAKAATPVWARSFPGSCHCWRVRNMSLPIRNQNSAVGYSRRRSRMVAEE